MKRIMFLAPLVCSMASAQTNSTIALWPNGAPGALGKTPNDIPTLTVYLPEPAKTTGAAIVVCPGGGYGGLAGHEGNDYALWLNQAGITAFVLKYRLGSHGYRHPRRETGPGTGRGLEAKAQ
jgi:acetyl esterase/lipase